MASSDSQIDKPQCGRPKRAELPDVNIDTDAQSINTDRASLILERISFETNKRIYNFITSFHEEPPRGYAVNKPLLLLLT